MADRNASVSARVYDSNQRMSTSPNVSASAQFTSDVSLASSNVTSYEDNGRQKVYSSTDQFYVIVTVNCNYGIYDEHLTITLMVYYEFMSSGLSSRSPAEQICLKSE